MDVALVDAVASVRNELLEAAARSVGAGVEFVVGPVELEFTVELRQDMKIKSGFKAWVVSGEAEGGLTSSRTHKVKLTLTPRAPGNTDLLVAGESGRPANSADLSGHIGR